MHCQPETVELDAIAFDDAEIDELDVTKEIIIDEGATLVVPRMSRAIKVKVNASVASDAPKIKVVTTAAGTTAILSGDITGAASASVDHGVDQRVLAYAYPTKPGADLGALLLARSGAATQIPLVAGSVTAIKVL